MPIRTVPATYHERIVEAARHAGGAVDVCRDLITAIPAAEPNRLRATLSTMLPAQVIVTGTLDRRLLLLQHPDGDRWSAADLAGQPHRTRTAPAPGRRGHTPRSAWTTPKAG